MSSVPAPFPAHPAPPALPERPEGLPPRDIAADWSPWTAIVALLVAIAVIPTVFTLVALAVVALVQGGVDAENLPHGVVIAATYAQDLGFVVTPLAAAILIAWSRRHPQPRGADFGLRAPARLWPAVGITVGVYVAFAVLSQVWVTVLDIKQKDDLPDQLGVDGSTAALVLVLLLVTVLAPVAEELLFRGYVFPSMRNWHGPWLAAVITGILFGGIHAGSSPVGFLVPLMLFGFGLCVIYQLTGSLLPGVALHALNNAIAFGSLENWAPGYIALVVVLGPPTAVLAAWGIGRGLDRLPRSLTRPPSAVAA